ncbi:TOBE domain-containing protein, partial [Saccharothrix sp. MB29]|nr:TOBE domain-containing protein [Saccharothrix sp. MB29]
ATRFVAGFIGTSNILDATVSGVDGGWARLDAPGVTGLRVPLLTRSVKHGQRVAATVRPEKVHLHDLDDEPPTGWCVLTGTVRDVVYTGVSTQYVVDVPGGGELVAFVQNTHRTTDAGAPGQPVRMAWDPDFTVLLESEHR